MDCVQAWRLHSRVECCLGVRFVAVPSFEGIRLQIRRRGVSFIARGGVGRWRAFPYFVLQAWPDLLFGFWLEVFWLLAVRGVEVLRSLRAVVRVFFLFAVPTFFIDGLLVGARIGFLVRLLHFLLPT